MPTAKLSPIASVILAALAAGLLAGCASIQIPEWKGAAGSGDVPVRPAQLEPVVTAVTAVPSVAISTAPPTRAALVAAARAEWDFFGNQQIDMRHEPFSAPRLGLLEDEGEAVQRVAEYWYAVGKNLTGADCQQAWSAAFISWLMVSSNVAPQDFTPSETHFNYLSFLRQRESLPSPQFVLRPAASEPIAPGDLLCAPRGSNAAATLDEIQPGLAGHCDMVVEVHANEGWAGVIGGNVFNSVSESLIPVDAQGRALPISQRPWLAVVKNLLP
ncbi:MULTISPECIES: DUF2272 domain-containing protein [unclassified Herbaspirillum]|uniref:DUF2272 domain-containing protein n=1 Tax=unclassified Herbaspirillum TaxID=2624150 RepID=UPI00114E3E4A|nr:MULTISPECIES: DUF2272 domain-containing protein [unclassified Herbaspirillum]MBB5392673.1 hypothetical protein [Herbaspirillum sp. SJZ102]TQK06309.1 hypothetical protein FB599_2456 [Herbaspirillum sp. SJZ130]TQK12213.1 hypothetical protein FB598_2164 [Herbaspirillum sp. SJZ106]